MDHLLSLPSLVLSLHPSTLALLALLLVLSRVLVHVFTADADMATLAAERKLNARSFEGQVAWVVGASSGIGEALCYELARLGASGIVLSARRVDRLEAVAARCRALRYAADEAKGLKKATTKPSLQVLVLPLDMLDLADNGRAHAEAAAEVMRQFGRIDLFFDNGGRSQRGLAERTPLSVDRGLLEVNVLGSLSLKHAVLPHMLAKGKGAIVTTSSIAGKVGSPISATYSASKAALLGYDAALRSEVAWRGVWVTTVLPGPVASEITAHAFTETEGKEWGKGTEDGTRRVPAERCARLMLAGASARLAEVWVAPQPILAFTYLAQYAPGLAARVGAGFVGPKRVQAFLGGTGGYDAVQGASVVRELVRAVVGR
jgi:dehydrogenase/reductase SDR family protein 7